MRRITIFMLAITISMFMIVSAHAVSTGDTIGNAGDLVVIDVTLTGADSLKFKTSPQIEMSWYSLSSGFSENAAHFAAYDNPGGQAYGMASDTNKVFWMSIEDLAAATGITAVTAADSSEFDAASGFQSMK